MFTPNQRKVIRLPVDSNCTWNIGYIPDYKTVCLTFALSKLRGY